MVDACTRCGRGIYRNYSKFIDGKPFHPGCYPLPDMDKIPKDILAAAERIAYACDDDYYWQDIFEAALREFTAMAEAKEQSQ